MGGDGTEITTSETSSVGVYGKLDHIIRRNTFPLIPRMRQFRKRQIPVRVHLLFRRRRTWRIHLDITVTDTFHEGIRMHHIRLCLNQMEVFCESSFIFLAFLERVENQCPFFLLGFACHVKGDLRNLVHIMPASSRFYAAGQFQHGLFAHSVAQIICPAPLKNGRNQTIFPIIVMRKSSKGCFHAADDYRNVRI